MTALVPISRIQKLALSEAPLKEVAEQLLTDIPLDDAPQAFPDLPEPLTATKEIRTALKVLSTTFNKTVVVDRRTMTPEEIAAIGEEYEAIQQVSKLLAKREEQVKEIVRTHQDVEAEEAGKAFPETIRRNGEVVVEATERDARGHYILSAKGSPTDTPIPGKTLRFSNQFSSGRTSEDLGAIDRMYAGGEIDETTYKAVTVTKRVPDPQRVRAYVLRTGNTWLLTRIMKRSRDTTALYLRSMNKK